MAWKLFESAKERAARLEREAEEKRIRKKKRQAFLRQVSVVGLGVGAVGAVAKLNEAENQIHVEQIVYGKHVDELWVVNSDQQILLKADKKGDTGVWAWTQDANRPLNEDEKDPLVYDNWRHVTQFVNNQLHDSLGATERDGLQLVEAAYHKLKNMRGVKMKAGKKAFVEFAQVFQCEEVCIVFLSTFHEAKAMRYSRTVGNVMPWNNIGKMEVLDLQFNDSVHENMKLEIVGTLHESRGFSLLGSTVQKDLFGPPVIVFKNDDANSTTVIMTNGCARNLRKMLQKGYITKYPEDIQFPDNINFTGQSDQETTISIMNNGVADREGVGTAKLQLPAAMLTAYPHFAFVQYIYNKYMRDKLGENKQIVVEHEDKTYRITSEET
eukprot:95130-Rhodomonas_salina.4